eukprot:403334689
MEKESKFQVHDLIVRVYAPQTTNDERKRVEAKLNELGDNVILHSSDVFEIISTTQIPQENPIKLQAGVYFMSYIKKILKHRVLENSELHYISENLIRILTTRNIQMGIKYQLQNALESVLFIDSNRASSGNYFFKKEAQFIILGSELVQKFFFEIYNNLFPNLNDQTEIDISGLFMVISALFKHCQSQEFILKMFQGIHQQMAKIVSQALITTIEIVMVQNTQIQQQLLLDPNSIVQVEYQNIRENLLIVKTWCQVHFEMLRKFKKLKFRVGINFIASSVEYAKIFNSILKFYIPPSNMNAQTIIETEGTLLTQTGDNNIDTLVNQIKVRTLKCLKIVWNYIIKKRPVDLYNAQNDYVQIAQYMIHIIGNSLIVIAGSKDFETMIEDQNISSMVVQGINIISSFCNEKDFSSYFTQNGFKIFIQVILPLLRLSEKDKDDIESNPKEFVNHQIDICQEQLSKTYQTQAAKLLESLIEHTDGMVTFVSNFCIEAIQNIMQGSGQTEYISQIITKFRLKFDSEQEFLEVCFLVLTIISDKFVKREDLRQTLDMLILQNLETFIHDNQTATTKSRFCLFLTFYLDQLMLTMPLNTQEESFEKILNFLITQLGVKGQKIVSIQALDTLSTQMGERVLTLKIQQNFDWLIQTLADYNQNLQLHAYFDFLADFIKSHYNNFTQDNLKVFMSSLTNRILKEQGTFEEKAGKKTLTTKSKKKPVKQANSKAQVRINKCFNTIRFIAEHDYFVLNFLDIIEQSLLPIFQYVENPFGIDFDDDIIFCLCSLMRKSKKVSPDLKQIFQYLPRFQAKYNGRFGHMLEALNYYIVYGKDFFENDQQNLQKLFEMASASIFKKERNMMLSDNMEGVMLLHMILQNLDGELIRAAKMDILTMVLSRLNDKPMSKTFQKVLLEVFLSSMVTGVDQTLEYLQKQGYLNVFLTTIFEIWRQMRQSYERKLLSVALTNLLFASQAPQEIQDQFGHILSELISVLIRQQRLEQKKLQTQKNKKKKNKNKMISALVDNILSDDDIKYDSDGEEMKESRRKGFDEDMDSAIDKPLFSVTKIQIPMNSVSRAEIQKDEEEEEKFINESDFKQEEYDLQFIVTTMISRLNDIDEFEYFNQNFRNANAQNPQLMTQIIQSSLSQKQQEYLQNLLQTRRIKLIGDENQQQEEEEDMNDEYGGHKRQQQVINGITNSLSGDMVPRKIVKIKKRNFEHLGGGMNNNSSSVGGDLNLNQN